MGRIILITNNANMNNTYEVQDPVTKKIINNKVFKANISKRRIRHSKKKESYQEQWDRIIEGYAQEIRELRKKRGQSMEKPNQKTDDGQPELAEIPDVSNNNDQENTGHVLSLIHI